MTAASEARAREVLVILRERISDHGDMHIIVTADELIVLRQALGVGWWEDQEESREIDAMVLEMLCVAAENRSAAMLAFASEEGASEARMREALNKIADLGSCVNGKRPVYKLLQEAIDIATAAL